MKLKTFAIRGIVFLAVFVAICMFFSGTVRTITTPKVHLTAAKNGRLEQRVELTCKPAFPNAEEIKYPLDDDIKLNIVRVNFRDGYTVQPGDVVVEAKVEGYDQLRKQYQDAYDTAADALQTLENKNRGIRINARDQAYADAYYALRNARRDAVVKELDMDAQLTREGLQRVDSGYPEGASDDLVRMIDEWRAAVQVQDEAQAAMDKAARYSIDDSVWTYITEKNENQQKMNEAEESLRKLINLNDSAKAITAPHGGYIAEITVKEGDSYDGSQALYKMTPEDELPSLRADISEVKRTVTQGMEVVINPDSYDSITTEITAIGTDTEGKRCADIEMTKAIINLKGSVYAMMQEDTTAYLIYRDREPTSLVGSSAVHDAEGDAYIWVAEKNEDAFGGDTLKARKVSVKVLGSYNGTVSIQDDITRYAIIYGEDRSFADGDTVMKYVGDEG